MKGNRTFIALLLGALLVFTLLIWQAKNTGVSSVLLPSELAALTGETKSRLRVAGRVAADTIDYQVEPDFRLRFSIHDPEQSTPIIKVEYKGIKPDMFASGRDVILDGMWQKNIFMASKLMTQCPSKYEPPSPEYSKNRSR